MNLLNGVGINYSTDGFSAAFFSGHGPLREPSCGSRAGLPDNNPATRGLRNRQSIEAPY